MPRFISLNIARSSMNYTLNTSRPQQGGLLVAFRRMAPFIREERTSLILAFIAIFFNSLSTLLAPVIIGYTLDTYVPIRDFYGIVQWSAVLLGIFVVGLAASYLQTKIMGGVGRRILFSLRNSIFNKLQELPVAFFNQNKTGDLISRINNDTDKLNQFFSQALMQFVGNFFVMSGAGIFLLSLNIRLGVTTLLPALGAIVLSQLLSGWVRRRNAVSLQATGAMSSAIQEGLSNFRVIVAFNRTDYFREKFSTANEENFRASLKAGAANNVFLPLYGLAAHLAQLVTVLLGLLLITEENLTLGLLVGYLLYVNNFYFPMRQLSTIWSSLQLALAAFDRIFEVLALESDMPVIPSELQNDRTDVLLSFTDVAFHYPDGKAVLQHVDFTLKQGKTYALVGPTGGGKTTTASLMARLYDPSEGMVRLSGRDIRSYTPEERARKIGFILQDPFLFTGTVRDNILYGNATYRDYTNTQVERLLEEVNLSQLLSRFGQGLDTPVVTSGNSVSLGQKQLIAFMRAVLRQPELLILDEATANIDTVTEKMLEDILEKLPATTTRVIIAHRLNTIKNADQIFFINAGEITPAGSMEHAMEMLLAGKRES